MPVRAPTMADDPPVESTANATIHVSPRNAAGASGAGDAATHAPTVASQAAAANAAQRVAPAPQRHNGRTTGCCFAIAWLVLALALAGCMALVVTVGGGLGVAGLLGVCLLISCVVMRTGVWIGLRPPPTTFTLDGDKLVVREPYCSDCCCPVPFCRRTRRHSLAKVADIGVFKQTVHYTVQDVGSVQHGGPATIARDGRCERMPRERIPGDMPGACDIAAEPCVACCHWITLYCCNRESLPSKECVFVGARVITRRQPLRYKVVQMSARVYLRCLVAATFRSAAQAQAWLASWQVHHLEAAARAEVEGLPPGEHATLLAAV